MTPDSILAINGIALAMASLSIKPYISRTACRTTLPPIELGQEQADATSAV